MTESGRVPARTLRAQSAALRWLELTGSHVLLVDPHVDADISKPLSARGLHTVAVSNTVDGLIEYGRTHPSVVVVASDAPGIPVVDFVSKIREYGDSLVIASLASASDSNAGELLWAGAGGAVVRPYSAKQLLEAVDQAHHSLGDHARVTFGPVELDARAFTVSVRGRRLPDFRLKEFELLRILMLRAPEVVENDELRSALWEDEAPSDNTIAVHVARLRRRLDGVLVVRRVRGRGYALAMA